MNGAEELKRFMSDLKTKEELHQKYDEALSQVDQSTLKSDSEAIAKAANELGYAFTAADLERASAEVEELDLAEMDKVAGGANNPKWEFFESWTCLLSYNCRACYETRYIDGDGHNDFCYATWHCYTALIHTNTSDDQEMACWSNYKCFAVNNIPSPTNK